MSKEPNSAGRPTQKQQIEIQETLREYFEKGVSATVTSHITGTNIKTVCKYFEEWSIQIKNINDIDFLNRIKLERERYLSVLDQQLLKLYQIQSEVEENNSFNYYKERMNLVNVICQIMSKKYGLLSENPEQLTNDISKN